MSGFESTMRIAVCIPTLHRHAGLERALRSVAAQEVDGVLLHAVVANNDPADRAPREISSRVSQATGLAIEVVDESARGTAPPRNAAMRVARASADCIAFLDDDEEATPRWLAALLAAKRAHGADIVTGGVVPRFESPPPAWATELRLFERPRRATGTQRPWAFTGNVLFDAALLDRLDSWFDPRFVQGEDRHFFARLAATGARIVWCADEPPVETVPAARLDPAWIARRMRAIGRAVTAIERDTPAATLAAPRNLAKGLVWIAIGSAQWLAGLAIGITQRVAGRRLVAYGCGLVEGSVTSTGSAGASGSASGGTRAGTGGSSPRS